MSDSSRTGLDLILDWIDRFRQFTLDAEDAAGDAVSLTFGRAPQSLENLERQLRLDFEDQVVPVLAVRGLNESDLAYFLCEAIKQLDKFPDWSGFGLRNVADTVEECRLLTPFLYANLEKQIVGATPSESEKNRAEESRIEATVQEPSRKDPPEVRIQWVRKRVQALRDKNPHWSNRQIADEIAPKGSGKQVAGYGWDSIRKIAANS